ncbi:hypothetical protein PUN28_017067 [Cardiocondyla obscurior]|uniref:Trichohyalin-plectin-homology domain-containing protein n=2 Tax=Cardiocondyla obscurior TaxID=286306 RepID=A0AAW2EK49_9HYME
MSEYEKNLQVRREKLRDLVSREEVNLTKEIAELAQRDERAQFEAKLARIEELKKQQEKEHETTVAAKQMQRYLASCPDVKQELSRRRAIDAKQCNVAQMADNETRRLTEKELDAVWHAIMVRDTEAKKHREKKEFERRTLAQQEIVSTLAKQVADKLALKGEKEQIERDEQKHLERLYEDMRQEELKNLEIEKQKREKLKKELDEQILMTKESIVKRARKEAIMDREYKMLAVEELAREKARAKQDTAALRVELDSYMKYLEKLQQEEVKRKLEAESLIRQSHENIEAKRELALIKFNEARRRAAQEVLRSREEQLKERQEAEKREQLLKIEEREAFEKQIEMDADMAATKQKENRQKTLGYGLELKEQQRCVETTRRHELEEERQYHQAEMKRQAEAHQRLADKLLNASESITPHPFKALLKECLKESPS